MKIWIHLNGIQQGPYTIEQLRLLPVDPSTPVWYEGLSQWMPAGEAAATACLFSREADATVQESDTAPVPAVETQTVQTPPRPSTFLVWNIILTVLCCSPLSLAGIITGAISSSRHAAGDYAGAQRMSNVTEWLLILSVVWIVLEIPFSIISFLL